MPHINVILTQEAHEFIAHRLQGTELRYGFEDIFDTIIRSGDRPYKPSHYPFVKDFLRCPAGHEYGLLSLRDVLKDKLINVAQEQSAKPAKAVATFLGDLDGRLLAKFLALKDDPDLERREQKLRRALDKLGYRLNKSRTRNPLGSNYRVYDIIQRTTHEISVDAPRHLEGLERWVEEQLGRKREMVDAGSVASPETTSD
jgi:hypothetical protein